MFAIAVVCETNIFSNFLVFVSHVVFESTYKKVLIKQGLRLIAVLAVIPLLYRSPTDVVKLGVGGEEHSTVLWLGLRSFSEPELGISLPPHRRLEGTGVGYFLSLRSIRLW